MSTTSVTVHCTAREPREFEIFMQSFDTFCVINLDVTPDSGPDKHNFNIMLPSSMFSRLAQAVDAFNAAMGNAVEEIEAAP